MLYTDFGKTGIKISRLGFGAMRLPIADAVEGKIPSLEEAAALLIRGFEQGINYVDTAYGYCGGNSERAVGLALTTADWRKRVTLSTKLPLWNVNSRDDFFRLLEEQLAKLQTDRIDFYHFHAVCEDHFKNRILKFKLIDEAAKALDQKMIGHLSFSFHDKVEVMKEVIDTGAFSSVLCQYNLLDRSLEEGIAYAHEKGLGVVAMGPVGGGRLAYDEGIFRNLGGRHSVPELALRFVLANPAISCALSGMGNAQMVDENVKAGSDPSPLAPDELAAIEKLLTHCAELKKVYCTGCNYCQPCPAGVRIPDCMSALIYRKVYGLEQASAGAYKMIGDLWHPGKPASACTHCGVCETKCPQQLKIRDCLDEVVRLYGK
ncbi:MAG: aldo/keto reductase [Victivallaceae bacterium]